MRKPETWEGLPDRLFETLLWDIDSLDYNGYESSKAECIDNILNENISHINRKIIDAYWKALTPERFKMFVDTELDSAKYLCEELEELLKD